MIGTKKIAVLDGLVLAFAVAPGAMAHEQGDWLMRLGASYADPKSNNSEIVSVDGGAAQVGVDIPPNDRWFLNFDLRWIDIDTDTSLDGAPVGSVEIEPILYGAHLAFLF